jgi:sugar phosphate isomerase/epimerase
MPLNYLTASTLGAPDESLDTVLSWLTAEGFTGIELRLATGHLLHPAMTRRQRQDVKSTIADAGIVVSGLASYVRVADSASDDVVVGALEAALMLAADLGAPVVRVFPGAPTHPGTYDRVPDLIGSRADANATAARRLNAVAALCEDLQVYPVLETHDSHPRGEDIAGILEHVEGKVGAVWDLMHPWRVGENLETTWQQLEPWLRNGLGSVQVKDARLPEDATPLPIGQGSLPVADFAALLRKKEYGGPICLEWEKTWHPKAERLDVALASTRRWFDSHWAADSAAL